MSTETYWASATASVRGLGIPPEFIGDIIGIDILAEAELAREQVDRRLGELGASLQHAVRQLAASLVEREEFRRQLEHEATHDGLTGLMNRSAAMESLTRSLTRVRRSDNDLAVLFIDVDEFKRINDRFGHNAGDIVLRAIADRIVDAIREGDVACRLVHTGHLLGASITAEGVETPDQAEDLLAMGSDHLQGYRYSTPLPPADLEAHVAPDSLERR